MSSVEVRKEARFEKYKIARIDNVHVVIYHDKINLYKWKISPFLARTESLMQPERPSGLGSRAARSRNDKSSPKMLMSAGLLNGRVQVAPTQATTRQIPILESTRSRGRHFVASDNKQIVHAPTASRPARSEPLELPSANTIDYLDTFPTLSVPLKQRATFECDLDSRMQVTQVSWQTNAHIQLSW